MSETKHPIEASASGLNAHKQWCEPNGQFRHYCTCARLVDAYKAGQLDGSDGTCSGAMNNRTCPALPMRAEEIKAGEAIYFTPRAGSVDRPGPAAGEEGAKIDKRSLSYKNGWFRAGQALGKEKAPERPKPAPAVKAKPKTDEFTPVDYSKVVTEMAAEERAAKPVEKPAPKAPEKPAAKTSSKPATTSAPASKPVPRAGESLLEMAKRLRAERAAPKAS